MLQALMIHYNLWLKQYKNEIYHTFLVTISIFRNDPNNNIAHPWKKDTWIEGVLSRTKEKNREKKKPCNQVIQSKLKQKKDTDRWKFERENDKDKNTNNRGTNRKSYKWQK